MNDTHPIKLFIALSGLGHLKPYGVAVRGLMVMVSDWGLGDQGSIPSWGKYLTTGFVLKLSSNMMATSVRIDGCADHMNKKSDLIIKNRK